MVFETTYPEETQTAEKQALPMTMICLRKASNADDNDLSEKIKLGDGGRGAGSNISDPVCCIRIDSNVVIINQNITIVQSYTGKYHKFAVIYIVTSVQHE